jgi:hypothetical protein
VKTLHSVTRVVGDRLLPINRRHLVFLNGTLVIEKVQSGVDGGAYRCEATNKQGNTARGTAQITVMGMLRKRIAYSFIILIFHCLHNFSFHSLYSYMLMDTISPISYAFPLCFLPTVSSLLHVFQYLSGQIILLWFNLLFSILQREKQQELRNKTK